MVKPTKFLPDPDDEVIPEVTRETLEGAVPPPPPVPRKAGKTRRSWYLDADVADRFADLVDDIHHQTRIPRHRVISALLTEVIDHAPTVQRKLMRGQL
ncbi:hypothetical protein ACFV5N_11745 [Streptomyces sp. NPDC059853]|uniref:hypothetical protein n=1 Tax=Streptomyces sp. NPDC059853 TaxID=3346973 RepID=UPI003654C3DB